MNSQLSTSTDRVYKLLSTRAQVVAVEYSLYLLAHYLDNYCRKL